MVTSDRNGSLGSAFTVRDVVVVVVVVEAEADADALLRRLVERVSLLALGSVTITLSTS